MTHKNPPNVNGISPKFTYSLDTRYLTKMFLFQATDGGFYPDVAFATDGGFYPDVAFATDSGYCIINISKGNNNFTKTGKFIK